MKIKNAQREIIFVAGGGGYIGSHACKQLYLAGYQPIVLDDFSTGHVWAVKWGAFERINLCDSFAVDAVFSKYQPVGVMVFAGFIAAGESIQKPIEYWSNNIAILINLVNSAIKADVLDVVFSSSAAIYGEPKFTPITETHQLSPINPYGETKLAGERFLENCVQAYGLRSLSLRYFNAAGADLDGELGEAHYPETHLIPLALRAAYDEKFTLDVYGADYDTPDGTCIRDYVHVSDIARAHVVALEYLRNGGGVGAVNLGAHKGYSVMEIIDAVSSITGHQVKFSIKNRRKGDPAVLIADNSKATKILNWTPESSSLHLIIESAAKWLGDL